VAKVSKDGPNSGVGRRQFVAGMGIAGVVTTAATLPIGVSRGETTSDSPGEKTPPAADSPAGYTYLKPAEAQFIEAVADHMIPKDELSGSGTELGVATYIDRALAGSWGKGDRLYLQGPWQAGTANQGYQLPLTPAELYRVAIPGCDAYCVKTFDKSFARCAAQQKETFLKDLAAGKIMLAAGLPGKIFFDLLYANVMEGMFADPIYGGNKDKGGWKLVGFPGVMANNAGNVKNYNDGRRYTADPVSIADMS
jgi:gluconate 2-dehydrogenase gamma chain